MYLYLLSKSFQQYPNNHHYQLTKCSTCVTLKTGIRSKRFRDDKLEEAKMHLQNHYDNVKLEKQDYYVRMDFSRTTDNLLSIAHDGMSKEKTKFPHLLEDRSKKLTDPLKMMCSLNLAVVHKKFDDSLDDQLHAFWNIDQISGAKSNATISQLMYTISKCNPIPAEISIQLDNCGSNKCYNALASFALLLLWVPKIKKIYICTPEVGHTHDDVDRYFGCLSRSLQRKQVYTPQGYQRFLHENFKSIVTNDLMPTTYDFQEVIGPNVIKNGQLFKNHYFELSRNCDNDAVVRIGRFLRSEQFLTNGPRNSSYINVFKDKPDLSLIPKILPRNELNLSQFNSLCTAVKNILSDEDYAELLSLPSFIEESPIEESFEVLLQRISDNVVTRPSSIARISDPENNALDSFLADPTIWKSWRHQNDENITNLDEKEGVQAEVEMIIEQDQITTEASATNKRSSITPEEQPIIIQKRPRGRPRKNQ